MQDKNNIINKLKNYEDKILPHELFLATRQTTEIKNVFAKNTPTDIKLSKIQIFKIILSGGSICSWFSNLGKKAQTNVVISLSRDNLLVLVSNLISDALKKKTSERELWEQDKDLLYLFLLKIWVILLK